MTLRPFLPLAERLGRLFSSLVAGSLQGDDRATIEICTEGDIAGYDFTLNQANAQGTTNFKGVAVNKTCWITKASESCS